MATPECDYANDPTTWDGCDCSTCLREIDRTCPLDIYLDTLIEFPGAEIIIDMIQS